MSTDRKKLLVIAGPTASGKTALSLLLAKQMDGEIVSADSMQIYRGMDIGTAKATADEQAAVPHHMLDLLEPGENYSVSRYVEDASAVCDVLFQRGKLPVVTGGTGLYIDALLAGRQFAGVSDADQDLREQLSRDYDRFGGEAMLQRLAAVDPDRAAKLAPTDRRRLIRALEVYELTGRTISEHDAHSRTLPSPYEALYVVLDYADRKTLYARIDERVDRMCENGLFEETQALLNRGIPDSSTCMQAIGYRQAAMALRGELSRGEAEALIKQATRRYAKRQLTWFRRHGEALRLAPDRLTPEEMALQVRTAFSQR
ncbi:MAG: tRNA (adenosine(37)-N6)-dimethylallyltransferase MiaA [Oscillospiraceae bacterium]|nr:tRNA (adenosine(37)-N6)-dimethylallyltransferase MiaA [Oscillospiraceae bacterium]